VLRLMAEGLTNSGIANACISANGLEGEQHVESPQREGAVDVEEVDREHAGGLRAQELPPTDVGVPDRCRWDAVALQDPPDGRGADTMAELEQLTLQPLVSLARGLPRHPHHQGDQDLVDRWPPGPARVGPSSAHEAGGRGVGGGHELILSVGTAPSATQPQTCSIVMGGF
jgi:hypothetical protein